MSDAHDKTTMFSYQALKDDPEAVRTVLQHVYEALQDKGYNPFGQIVGYLISGDPTFITSHRNARSLILQIEKDVILEELVTHYLKQAE
ncbi:MAG TPA: IreB family regulatory phosphoprotein [Limnochordia bacterium]|nr:IreB family regulatory phosphoprotein [Limnochordia bacterium]